MIVAVFFCLFVCCWESHHNMFVSSDAACRLYFDLEFDRQLNPDHNGESMVDIFLQVMHACLTFS